MITLRWYIWGTKEVYYEMLKRSIASFRKYFQKEANYIVSADDPNRLHQYVPNLDAVYPNYRGLFSCPLACYRKMAPQLRLAEGTEILIDSDIFCLSEPTKLYEFIDGDYDGLLQSREGETTDTCGYGMWFPMISKLLPPCCYGLMGMQNGYDPTDRIIHNFYQTMKMADNFWNDQGAVIKAMEDDILSGRIFLMKEEGIRYYSPLKYFFDVQNEPVQMIHCIAGASTDYYCFRKLLGMGLI